MVSSGVTQGTVLGPLLFLAFINDLPDTVTDSTVKLFADDCILYRVINTQDDAAKLQQDLDRLQQWEKTWLMDFHPDKCQLLRVTNKRKVISANYSIHGHKLLRVDKAKYHTGSPYYQKDIDCLERVQRRCARFVHQDFSRHSSATAMIQNLGWELLAERRAQARVTMLYKAINGLVAIPVYTHLQTVTSTTRGI